MRRLIAMTALVVAAAAGPAAAHETTGSIHAEEVGSAALPARCPGAEIDPTIVFTGSFGREVEGSYVLIPFGVPEGATAVRIKYCFDQPESPLATTPVFSLRHTLDLGLYEPRDDPARPWGPSEFRGWGGSSHPDVTVSRQGFSTEEQYLANPRGHVPGRTTRGFLPGPVPAGQWAVELGVAAVVPQSHGDGDGRVAWRVEIEIADEPAFAADPYRPAGYDARPARSEPGWYAGDFHVHGEHSALGDATMSELLDFAFRSRADRGAGLDFITLSDYVAGAQWSEIGRYQGRHPDKLVVRSAEVITYRGHANSHANTRHVDYRTGALYEYQRGDGSLRLVRGPRPAAEILDEIRGAGGFTQISHPEIFPSEVPTFSNFCRGCSWDYSAAETRYEEVDAIEVATGPAGLQTYPFPGPNPFTLLGVDFYEQALDRGRRIAAVGSSDSHNAGRSENPVTQSPIGQATTVVFANELSERGVQAAVEAGHTYVKMLSSAGPDLRFKATPLAGGAPSGIMGDTVYADSARFEVRVTGRGAGPEPLTLIVTRDGSPESAVPVTSDDFRHSFVAARPGRYGLRLMRGTSFEAVSTPIWLEPLGNAPRYRRPAVRGFARRRIRTRRGRFPAACEARGSEIRSCRVHARYRPRAGRTRTIAAGSTRMTEGAARISVRLTRLGRSLLRRRGRVPVTLSFVVEDAAGRTAVARRRATLR